jgi:hypothetical protein
MATSTYLANPTVAVGTATPGTDITDQCISAVVTATQDQLEKTAFGSTNRTYTAGLTDVTVTLTFLVSYASSETYALLQPLLGAAATYVAVKPTSGAISTTNPEFQLTNGYLASLDYVNAQLGELSQLQAVFQGGTLVIKTTP